MTLLRSCSCRTDKGDRDAQYPCPQAVEAVEEYFMLPVHERWTEREVRDAGAAVRKVHAALMVTVAAAPVRELARV
jgi:hypothetical protein